MLGIKRRQRTNWNDFWIKLWFCSASSMARMFLRLSIKRFVLIWKFFLCLLNPSWCFIKNFHYNVVHPPEGRVFRSCYGKWRSRGVRVIRVTFRLSIKLVCSLFRCIFLVFGRLYFRATLFFLSIIFPFILLSCLTVHLRQFYG